VRIIFKKQNVVRTQHATTDQKMFSPLLVQTKLSATNILLTKLSATNILLTKLSATNVLRTKLSATRSEDVAFQYIQGRMIRQDINEMDTNYLESTIDDSTMQDKLYS